MHKHVQSYSAPVLASTLAAMTLLAASLLSGCALGTSSAPETETMTATITGRIHGGEQPISGGTVQLWKTGTTGYGAGATLVASASAKTATGTGTFSIPSTAISVNCATGPYYYIVASGGDSTGTTQNNTNSAILMADLLPVCSGGAATATNTGSFVVDIDEVTTVAAAYTLRAFTTVSGTTINIGAPATNAQGLADAFANFALLVTGGAIGSSPNLGLANASTATVEVPTGAINSLANSTAYCVDTAYNTAPANCNTFFGYATPPTSGTPAAPTNIYQALLNIAAYPGANVSNIVNLGMAAGPFAPSLAGNASASSVLNDLTLGVAYPNTTLAGASVGAVGITIDNTDNVWVLGAASGTSASTFNYLGELPSASAGGAYTATLQSLATLNGTHTIRNGAFDTLGNLWITDKSSTSAGVIELASPVSLAPATAPENTFTTLSAGGAGGSLDPNDYFLAIDAGNNIWTASYGAQGKCVSSTGTAATVCEYIEYVKSGSSAPYTYTPTNTFNGIQETAPTVRSMQADTVSASPGLGNIWTANYGNTSLVTTAPGEYGSTVSVLTPSTGALSAITISGANSDVFSLALDKVGGAYVDTESATGSGLYYVPQSTANGATIASTVATTGTATALASIPNSTSAPASTATTVLPIGGVYDGPGYIAVDGAGNVWVANYNYGTFVEYSPALVGYLSPYYGFGPSIATVALPANETLFTCTTTTSTTCTFPTAATYGALANKKSLNTIAIDRAGSVWSMDSAGTLVEVIGTASPTNPILAAGQATLP